MSEFQKKHPDKRCPKCGWQMRIGMALQNKLSTTNDPLGGTIYETTEAETIECYKCTSCGHSEKPITQ